DHQREEQGEELTQPIRRDLLARGNDEDGEERRAEEDPGEEHPHRVVLQQAAEEWDGTARRLPGGERRQREPEERAGGERLHPPRAAPREQVLDEHAERREHEHARGPEEPQGRNRAQDASYCNGWRSVPSERSIRLMIAAG